MSVTVLFQFIERETQQLGGVEAGITQLAMGPGPLTQGVELHLALSLTGSQKVAAAIAIRHCTKTSRRRTKSTEQAQPQGELLPGPACTQLRRTYQFRPGPEDGPQAH